jgi:hypothetical protein
MVAGGHSQLDYLSKYQIIIMFASAIMLPFGALHYWLFSAYSILCILLFPTTDRVPAFTLSVLVCRFRGPTTRLQKHQFHRERLGLSTLLLDGVADFF